MQQRESCVSPDKMKALRKLAETRLSKGPCFEEVRALGPVRVRLRCNEYDVYRSWRENWLVAPPADDGELPAAAVTVATSIDGHAPAAYHCPQAGEVAFLNASSYGLCRTWALGMAAELALRQGWVGLRAASFELAGRGVLALSGDAALLAAFALGCALRAGAALQNVTWCWLVGGGAARPEPVRAVRAEGAFLLPARCATHYAPLGALLREAPSESVVRRKDECTNMECLTRVARRESACELDAPGLACYGSSPEGALLVNEGMLSPCRPRREPLEVTDVVLLGLAQEGRDVRMQGLEARQAALSIRRGLEPHAVPWSSPELFRPFDEAYRRLVRRCMAQARALELRVPQGGLEEAVGMLAQSCSEMAH